MKERKKKIKITDLAVRARSAASILALYIGAKRNLLLKEDGMKNDTITERINLLKQYHHAE